MSNLRGQEVKLGKIRVWSTDLPGALQNLSTLLTSGKRHYICFCEANLLASIYRDREVAELVNQASMVLPDGIALSIMAWALDRPVLHRVPGPSFLLEACRYGVERGYRHFFYGGTMGGIERLVARLKSDFPGIQIAGYYSPPFRDLTGDEEEDIRKRIEARKPHLLWVSLGGPKQEMWMRDHLGRINVPVMLGVGAAFDFHSGSRPWAPRCIRRIGLEWLFRCLTGGQRVLRRNALCVPRVALVIAREFWRERVRCFGGDKKSY